jgi:hypothetical protein
VRERERDLGVGVLCHEFATEVKEERGREREGKGERERGREGESERERDLGVGVLDDELAAETVLLEVHGVDRAAEDIATSACMLQSVILHSIRHFRTNVNDCGCNAHLNLLGHILRVSSLESSCSNTRISISLSLPPPPPPPPLHLSLSRTSHPFSDLIAART